MDYVKAAAGAIGGAVAGAVVFILLARAGLHAGMLMGAGAGWGVQLAVRDRNLATGVIALVAGLVASVLAEWYALPFMADPSLPFFLAHLHQINFIHLLLLGAGVVAGFFWAKGP
ncbi:hypothetical protein Pla123a_23160 [Posidoniimonas polymericola]|uniref:Uncharacterized protein n=1 Tax=Posidoniimonas polymericola TaxID=2528002 RepID=A0A5C5YPK5_9BACT|nr:hypothetical protein [Posidoniimonas polymericola]TWT76892.1 hypothetical protein Pla123a_23160 [Posidoniimonas polymericola]